MIRNILALLAGVIAAVIIIGSIQMLGQYLFPPPEGLDASNPEKLEEYIRTVPVTAFLYLLFSYMVGAFTAGLVAAALGKGYIIRQSLLAGFIIMLAGLANLIHITHPTWFTLASLIIYLPAAYAGGWLVRRKRQIRTI